MLMLCIYFGGKGEGVKGEKKESATFVKKLHFLLFTCDR